MFEKEIADITKMLDDQVKTMRMLRIKLLMACFLGLSFVGLTTYSAFTTGHTVWGVILSIAELVLIAWTIRLVTFKV